MVTRAARVKELEETSREIAKIANIPASPVWSPEFNAGKLHKIKKKCEKVL